MHAYRRSPFIAIACLGALVPPVHAANERTPKPALVVREGAVTLKATDDDDGALCLELSSARGESTSCGDDGDDDGLLAVGGARTGGVRYAGVAAPASAARVELRRAGRLLTAGPTVGAGAYRGKSAGRVRFALLRMPPGGPVDGLRVHALDATGALVSVFTGRDSERVFARRRLLAGRSGRVRWALTTSRSSELEPSVLDLAHETVSRCVDVRVQIGPNDDNSRSCHSGGPQDSLEQAFAGSPETSAEDRCKPDFRLLHGVVSPSVRRVTVVLGDGRRRAVRAVRTPDGERLAYALPVAPGVAVRRVELQEAGGRTRVLKLSAVPVRVACVQESLGSSIIGPGLGIGLLAPFADLPAVTPVGPVATLAGPPPMRVADGPAETLCVTVGDQPFTAPGCAIVSPDLDELVGSLDSYTKPRTFALALPARVATVRIAAPDAKVARDIPTVPGTGYSGRYAGHVRFASATVASERELARFELLDAAGNVLHRDNEPVPDDDALAEPTAGPPRRIAGRAGGPSLWQTKLRFSKQRMRCVALTTGRPPADSDNCQTIRGDGAVLLAASCSTGA